VVQVKQGAHASKFQQADWRAGRKGGATANVDIDALPDDRASAFTDVQVAQPDAQPAAAKAAPAAAAADTATTNGHAKVNGSAASEAWSKDQEVALVRAIKAIGKDVPDRCAVS
jgi:hypothetical protein